MKTQVFSSTIRRKEMDAVLSCMVSERIGPGELNIKLVQQVKEHFSVDGCAALRSPAIALKYALKALDLPAESGVMISALAPAWQFYAIKELGYNPIILDVAQETALVTPANIEEGIKNGGRVLILHETLGFVPDFSAICALGVPIIEDISQNAGSLASVKAANSDEIIEQNVGTFGLYTILGLEENDILTAGGGAVLLAPKRREWIVLKKFIDEAPITDILPDINSALASVQIKERSRNEQIRREMKELYIRSLMQGRHATFMNAAENATNAVYSFPVLLSSGLKDVKQYANRKEIELENAFDNSVVAKYEEFAQNCSVAKSLLLRTVLFPLYPRLGMATAAKIAKVLATLP